MPIQLTKGQSINLSKDAPGLTKAMMGLGWDMLKAKGGFLGGLFGGGGQEDIDLDASAVLFSADRQPVDAVWFGQLASKDGSIRHGGDNLTGAGDGDDEVIYLDLTNIHPAVATIVFSVSSFRGQTFDKVANAFCRIVNQDNRQEIARYNLSAQGPHTSILVGKLYRKGTEWEFTAIGQTLNGRTINDLIPAMTAHI